MGLSMFYITVEWCQQSFLSTESYKDAMSGLRMTRIYRSWTFFARRTSRALSYLTVHQFEKIFILAGVIKKPQKTLLWTKEHTWNPVIPPSLTERARGHTHALHTYASPSIELTDCDVTRSPSHVQDIPAMAHSLFDPAINVRRARIASDASLSGPDPLNGPRTSDDSSASLIQRLSQVHHHGETDGRTSSEGCHSFETPFIERDFPAAERWLSTEGAVHNRQGYRRANSESGVAPDVTGSIDQGGLGIKVEDVDLERGAR
jgi:hypothetical protein